MAVPIVIFDFFQLFRNEKGLMRGAQYLLELKRLMSESLLLTQTHWTTEYKTIFYDYDKKKLHCMEIENATGEILNWLKAFGK